MRKPKVGDKLFLVDTGNLARQGLGKQRMCVVSKVGRKYFWVKENEGAWSEIQFYIEDWIQTTNYTCDYVLYENRQAWEDAKTAVEYRGAIRREFDYDGARKYTLSQLMKVTEILGIKI